MFKLKPDFSNEMITSPNGFDEETGDWLNEHGTNRKFPRML